MSFNFLPLWFFLLIVPLFLLHTLVKVKRQKNHLPPSPPMLPILGNLHHLGELPHQSLYKLSKKYGPIMFLKIGRISDVIISSAEAAREVLKIQDLECCGRPELPSVRKLTYNFRDIALGTYCDSWKKIRKICILELFSIKRVQSFQFIREEEVGLMINSISESTAYGLPINLSEKAFALAGSVIFRIGFGRRFGESGFDNKGFNELMHKIASVLGGFSMSDCFPYVGWIIDKINGYQANVERVFHELDTLFEHIIAYHLNPKRKLNLDYQEDIIDVMLKLQRDQIKSGDAWLTKDHIKATLLDILFGGVDTNAITITWAIAELIKNPRIMKKAQDEVRNCIGKKERVTEDDINQLQYLKLIIKETLRLHPPGALLVPRKTLSHIKLKGYEIYPGTVIQVNVWAIGRDPKYWENPEIFYPERFINNDIDFNGQHFEFLPFGAGRRGCPGMRMAMSLLELALANILYCFDWKLPNGMKEEDVNMEESSGVNISVCKKTPLNLVPIRYLP